MLVRKDTVFPNKNPQKNAWRNIFFGGLNGGLKELDYQVSGKIWRIKWRIKDGAWRIKWRIKPGLGGLNWRNKTGAFRRISGFGCHGRAEKCYLCHPKSFCMNKSYKKNKQTIDMLLIILFWTVLSTVFLSTSALRPYCVQHPYKELLSAFFLLVAVAGSRWIAYPRTFQRGRRAAFWLVSAALLFLSAGAELLTINNELAVCNPYIKENPGYMLSLFLSLLARNTGIFSFRMLFALQSYYEGRLQNVSTDTDNPDCPQVVTGTNDNSRSPETPSETHPETGTEPERGPAEGTLSELESRLSSIFGIVERNPGCNARFIAEQFPSDTSVRTIERCIAELRKQGKIQYDGSKRFGGYRVVKQREDGRGASAS